MKPIACVIDGKLMKYSNDPLPDECLLYPEREWVGLTHREFQQAVEGLEDLEDCWVQIEEALKEKNTFAIRK